MWATILQQSGLAFIKGSIEGFSYYDSLLGSNELRGLFFVSLKCFFEALTVNVRIYGKGQPWTSKF